MSGSANRWSSRFWNGLPQTRSTTAWASISGLGITWALQSVPHLSSHDFTPALLVLALVKPACLLWVSPYSSVSFLLCYTPLLKATLYMLVTGRFHEDSSTASVCIYVYTVTGDPQMGDWICVSFATGLQPGEEKRSSPLQLQIDAGFDISCLKAEFVWF